MARRRSGTFGDMLRSMIILVPLLLVAWAWSARTDSAQAPSVDALGIAREAAAIAPYRVLAPASVPTGWRANNARISPASVDGQIGWHAGFVTDTGAFVGVDQSTDPDPSYVEGLTKDGEVGDDVAIDGETWQRRSTDTEHSLVLAGDGVTTVVTGTAAWDVVEAFAGDLVPVDPPAGATPAATG